MTDEQEPLKDSGEHVVAPRPGARIPIAIFDVKGEGDDALADAVVNAVRAFGKKMGLE